MGSINQTYERMGTTPLREIYDEKVREAGCTPWDLPEKVDKLGLIIRILVLDYQLNQIRWTKVIRKGLDALDKP